MGQPTYQQERDHDVVRCESCGEWVHECTTTYDEDDRALCAVCIGETFDTGKAERNARAQ